VIDAVDGIVRRRLGAGNFGGRRIGERYRVGEHGQIPLRVVAGGEQEVAGKVNAGSA
jgi:hypothetical protein